jgi:hypothetical protein
MAFRLRAVAMWRVSGVGSNRVMRDNPYRRGSKAEADAEIWLRLKKAQRVLLWKMINLNDRAITQSAASRLQLVPAHPFRTVNSFQEVAVIVPKCLGDRIVLHVSFLCF